MSSKAELAAKVGKTLGLVLSGVALACFAYFCVRALRETNIQRVALQHWKALLVATIVYCLAYIPLTVAWVSLARAAGAQAGPLSLAKVLLVSQLGKYVPGNLAQFFGRAYMARRYGVPLSSSGIAIGLELAGVLAASGVLATAAISLGMTSAVASNSSFAWVAAACGVGALAGSALVLRSRNEQGLNFAKPLLRGFLLYVLVLLLLAIANGFLITAIGPDKSVAAAEAVGSAFVVSWLVGFVTPGSPAGLGLRELTFFGLLASDVPHESLLLTALAFRFATIVGDVLAFSVGLLLPSTEEEQSAPEPIPI